MVAHNNSLDRSGGGVFRKMIRPAKVSEYAPPGQLNRYAARRAIYDKPLHAH
jgi:hypothetical protein